MNNLYLLFHVTCKLIMAKMNTCTILHLLKCKSNNLTIDEQLKINSKYDNYFNMLSQCSIT